MKLNLRAPKILDFDTESRPLTYGGGDFTFSEITAIAWGFDPSPDDYVQCVLLGSDDQKWPLWMFRSFADAYNEADIVTGHYIRMHDLPRINAGMAEYGLPALPPKLTIDTYSDLKTIQGISKSQENMATMLGLEAPKVGMSQAMWRKANRLETDGLTLTRNRVVGDVRQHIALRAKLNELGWLNPPQMWRGGI